MFSNTYLIYVTENLNVLTMYLVALLLALLLKLVNVLIWPMITYGAEGWTKKDDERRLERLKCGATEECCG